MAIAAVPKYLGEIEKDFEGSSPGMRFNMYLMLWSTDYRIDNKLTALKAARKLNGRDQAIMRSLWERQKSLFNQSLIPEARFYLDAIAISPFTTGLGNAHPLENGFAFLNPYGLPYLPGSGVKGVLRQAARELASGEWGESYDWNESELSSSNKSDQYSKLDILFGFESGDGDKEHMRGVLSFWDVIPQIVPADKKKPNEVNLMIEIMTPHQSHYYQKKETPHESGIPSPIYFLTVPPESRFVFYVSCDLERLLRIAPELAEDGYWKTLLEAAFNHAYDWLGFGAKTAVGYGAMKENPEWRNECEKQKKERLDDIQKQTEAKRVASLTPDELSLEEHQPIIDKFLSDFETAKKTPYKPGCQFDNTRFEFEKCALVWVDTASRRSAGRILKETMTKSWGIPSNKDSKKRLEDALVELNK